MSAARVSLSQTSVLLFFASMSACMTDLTVPSDTTVTCATDSECPQGRHCVVSLGQCAGEETPCVESRDGTFVAAADGNRCVLTGGDGGVCIGGLCVAGRCGDGFVTNEACDDGNTVSGDGCRGDCAKIEACGDGTIDVGEVCDDGNTTSGDGCRADCHKVETCGDGIVDANESCDDANDNPSDGCEACADTAWSATQLIGSGESGGDPAEVNFFLPRDVAVDNAGNLYVTEPSTHRVYRVDGATKRTTVIAGDGTFGFSGDGGPATAAKLWAPTGVALDSRGVVYIADSSNRRVRRVDPDSGVITTIAGSGANCSPTTAVCGDGSSAANAALNQPVAVAVGNNGLYIADMGGNRIRRVDLVTGVITTVAGNGTACSSPTAPCGDGPLGVATSANLNLPRGIAVSANALYIADWGDQRVRVVDLTKATPTIAALAGDGNACDPGTGACGDGPLGTAVTARLSNPIDLELDRTGGLLIGEGYDFGTSSSRQVERVRRVDLTLAIPTIATVAGSGATCSNALGGCGDGGSALAATFASPGGVAVDTANNVIIVDQNDGRVRRLVRSTGIIEHLAGSGRMGNDGDGGFSTAAIVQAPRNIAIDAAGNIYFADQLAFVVRRIDAVTGVISTVAGAGSQCGFSVTPCPGDGGIATAALLRLPASVAVDDNGSVYIGDIGEKKIRRVDPNGMISTFAGTGTSCTTSVAADDCGDNQPAAAADLGGPFALRVHGNALFVAQTLSPRVRRIDLAGATHVITNVVGDGVSCSAEPCGEDGPPASAELSAPSGLDFDAAGNLLVVDSGLGRVYRVTLSQVTPAFVRVAGTTTPCAGPCDDDPLHNPLNPRGVVVGALGDIFISNYSPPSVMRVYFDAIAGADKIAMVLGTGSGGHTGDGGPGGSALLNSPEGLALRGSTLYVAENDSTSSRVRRFDMATNRVDSLVGVDPLGDAPFTRAALANPLALSRAGAAGAWLVADGTSRRVRRADLTNTRLDTAVGYPQGTTITGTPMSARFAELLETPSGVAYDGRVGHGDLYVAQRGDHTIVKVHLANPADSATWTVTTFAGQSASPGGPGAPSEALPSRFASPMGLAFASSRAELYVADTGNHVIRVINVDAATTTVLAGAILAPGFLGEGTAAANALLDSPRAVALNPDESTLYIADTGNHRVRSIDVATGLIDTVLGDGSAGSSGTGGPARIFPVDTPAGLAIDTFGNLFVSSRNTIRVVSAGASGIATGDDPVATIYGRPPRSSFPEAVTKCLSGVAVEPGDGAVLVLDACIGAMIEVKRQRLPTP